jgi:hypothetical protein
MIITEVISKAYTSLPPTDSSRGTTIHDKTCEYSTSNGECISHT